MTEGIIFLVIAIAFIIHKKKKNKGGKL